MLLDDEPMLELELLLELPLVEEELPLDDELLPEEDSLLDDEALPLEEEALLDVGALLLGDDPLEDKLEDMLEILNF